MFKKNNPKAEQIRTDNEYRMRWNHEVDRAIVSGVAEIEIQQIKKEYISDRIRESADVFGNQQSEIIFEAEKERNVWELERDDLKGFARFTKKGELQSRIDCKNEEIDILKIGLFGIAKRYGYKNVQVFYRTYHQSHSATEGRDKPSVFTI